LEAALSVLEFHSAFVLEEAQAGSTMIRLGNV
jgi:hypothetical protein